METGLLITDGERRHATVLFADISGFTALSEKMDPEEVTSFINRCFEALERIVFGHGGIVDKYLGDCMMAVFGLVPTSPNPAAHAVQAALEVREAVRELNRIATLPGPIDVHVGINTGPVLAGMMGGDAKRELTLMGDTVDLAIHLENASDTGQIFVGPETFRETSTEFDYRPLAPVHVDPHPQPVQIYELLAVRPTRHVTRDSERRQATVMFADIFGLRALSEHTSAEAVTQLMNTCFAPLAAAVVNHGGVVDKYVGTCMMALFGVPNAIEDAPKQAINAAIEIRNWLGRFNQEQQLPVRLRVHIGINTGLVIAGDIGGRVKRKFTVMGDAANLASRLKDAAVLGSIYVGPDTYRYSRDAFEYRALPPFLVKGKQQPVQAYELLSVTEQIHRTKVDRAERMIFSEMVGRDRELARITEALTALIGGRGGIVMLAGDAGLGKSRLIAEVSALTQGMDCTVLEGRSLAIGQSLSFHPFIDLLKRWSAISEDDDETAALTKLEGAIGRVCGDVAAEVFPFVATLMGMRPTDAHAERLAGIEGEAMEKLIVKSVRELLRRMAAARPLVLIFEDLHWADLSSIQLLEALLRLALDSRILFMPAFRPDYAETAQRIQRSARDYYPDHCMEIVLGPLDDRQCDILIGNLLKGAALPYATRQLIRSKAEGSPFFIEEVVRALIDQGVIEFRNGHPRVTEKVDTVVIPSTIQEVIMARVDRLDEPMRHVLQIASIIGRSFYHQILAAIMEDAVDLNAMLAQLQERQFLLERRTRRTSAVRRVRLQEELEYVFEHALIQETIYESILQKTRKELHLKVAGTIESLFADHLVDFYGMLAYHYSRAEDLAKAEEYLFKAGDEAARAAASSEALHFFREASRLYFLMHGAGGDPNKRSLLEKNVGLALLNKGNLLESIDHFDKALEFLTGERVPSTRFALARRFAVDLAVLLGRLYLNRVSGRPRHTDREEFDIRYNRARAQTTSDAQRFVFDSIGTIRRMTERDPTVTDQAVGMFTASAAVFVWSGISFAVGKRILAVAKNLVRPGNARDEFGYRSWKFVLHYLEGDWSDAHAVPDELLEHALRYGQFWDVNTYLGLNCERLMYRGDFVGARQEIERIAQLADVYGFDFARSNEYAMPAFLALMERRFPDALSAVDRYYNDRHEDLLHLNALGIKAKIQVVAGDRDATETLTVAEALRRRLGQEVPGYHRSMLVLSRLLSDVNALEASLRDGDRGTRAALARQARRSARQAVRIAGIVARERVEAYRLTGRLCWLTGRRGRAARWWERSVHEAERLGAQPELARTYLEIGHRLGDAGRGTRVVAGLPAAAYIDKATRLFEELHLEWDLRQANQLAAERTAPAESPREFAA